MITTDSTARLAGRTIERSLLTDGERHAMFDLLATFFTGVDELTFETDLKEKSHVILLEDDGGVVRGFSTLLIYQTEVPGVDATIVYSGDTIVDRDWWGSLALPVSWLRAVRTLSSDPHADAADAAGARTVYWLLLTSGFRTYRFLPVFWRDFCPRYDSAAQAKDLMDALAEERFGQQYDAARGIVRFARPQVLVPELLDVPSGRALDEHVAFFLERNPGYTRGDELVCLTNLSDSNLTGAGRRIARKLKG
jgi:hypothetical protein